MLPASKQGNLPAATGFYNLLNNLPMDRANLQRLRHTIYWRIALKKDVSKATRQHNPAGMFLSAYTKKVMSNKFI